MQAPLPPERRLQLVIDIDNTLLHATAPQHGVGLRFTPKPSEARLPLYEVFKLRRGNLTAVLELYNAVHEVPYVGGGGGTFAFRMRPFVFEALESLRLLADLHVYTKGERRYIDALLAAMFGPQLGAVFNGQTLTRTEDAEDRKDLRKLLAEELFIDCLVVDDQPAVWLQLPHVIPVPPFFVRDLQQQPLAEQNFRFEERAKHLLNVVRVCKEIASLRRNAPQGPGGGLKAVQALRMVRSRFFARGAGWGVPPRFALHVDGMVSPDPQQLAQLLSDMVRAHGGKVTAQIDEATHLVSNAPHLVRAPHGAQRVSVAWLVDALLYLNAVDARHYDAGLLARDRPFLFLRMDYGVEGGGGAAGAGAERSLMLQAQGLLQRLADTELEVLARMRAAEERRAQLAARAGCAAAVLLLAAVPLLLCLEFEALTCEARLVSDEPSRRRRDGVRRQGHVFVVKAVGKRSVLRNVVREGDVIRAWLAAEGRRTPAAVFSSVGFRGRSWLSRSEPENPFLSSVFHLRAEGTGALGIHVSGPRPLGDTFTTHRIDAAPLRLGLLVVHVGPDVRHCMVAAAVAAVVTTVGGESCSDVVNPSARGLRTSGGQLAFISSGLKWLVDGMWHGMDVEAVASVAVRTAAEAYQLALADDGAVTVLLRPAKPVHSSAEVSWLDWHLSEHAARRVVAAGAAPAAAAAAAAVAKQEEEEEFSDGDACLTPELTELEQGAYPPPPPAL